MILLALPQFPHTYLLYLYLKHDLWTFYVLDHIKATSYSIISMIFV